MKKPIRFEYYDTHVEEINGHLYVYIPLSSVGTSRSRYCKGLSKFTRVKATLEVLPQ